MPSPQYFAGLFKQLASQACLVDTTPPTFAGVTGVTAESSGAIKIDHGVATDATLPIEYKFYVALGVVNAATLFAQNPVMHKNGGLGFARVFTLNDHATFFVKGLTYTVGVRAEDGVGNTDSNTAILTVVAIASGNLPTVLQDIATDLAATHVDLADDHANFQDDHTTFQDDHTNFENDHANFQDDHADFQADLTQLENATQDIVDAAADISGILDLADQLQEIVTQTGGLLTATIESVELTATIED